MVVLLFIASAENAHLLLESNILHRMSSNVFQARRAYIVEPGAFHLSLLAPTWATQHLATQHRRSKAWTEYWHPAGPRPEVGRHQVCHALLLLCCICSTNVDGTMTTPRPSVTSPVGGQINENDLVLSSERLQFSPATWGHHQNHLLPRAPQD